MVWVRKRRGWEIPERLVTPEDGDPNRRDFFRFVGLGGLAAAGWLPGCSGPAYDPLGPTRIDPTPPGGSALYPAKLNAAFGSPGRELTPELVANKSNKFYEFSLDKALVWKKIETFQTRPWTLEIGGLCGAPLTAELNDIVRKMPLEERIYKHRCIEGWAKTVPWTGFPLRKLLESVQPLPEAKFVRFVTFHAPDQAGNQNNPSFPWPYTEGLTIEEAMNELSFVATGSYGHALSKQQGAPVRLIVPWKYATKSIKSIVQIELTAQQPDSFWNTISPREVSWTANVDPAIPHPRWNQTHEWLLGISENVPSEKFNGYGKWVEGLYRQA